MLNVEKLKELKILFHNFKIDVEIKVLLVLDYLRTLLHGKQG